MPSLYYLLQQHHRFSFYAGYLYLGDTGLKIYGLALPIDSHFPGGQSMHCSLHPHWLFERPLGSMWWVAMAVLSQEDADPAPSLTSQGLPLQKQPLHAQYLPFLVSCCRMFLIKWTFLKFFGLGDPESVRHLKNKSVAREGREKRKKNSQFPAVPPRSLHKSRKERRDKWFKSPCVRNQPEQ